MKSKKESTKVTPEKLGEMVSTNNLVKLTELVDQGGDLNDSSFKNLPLLHMATALGHVEIGKYLITKGADVNKKDQHELTALHIAVRYNQIEMFKLLMLNKADPNIETSIKGSAVVNMAYEREYYEMVKYALEKGANPHTLQFGYSLLHNAAADGNYEILKCALENGADVNLKNANGETILHVATLYNKFDVVKLLVANKADINIVDKDNMTVLDLAIIEYQTEIIEFYLEIGATFNPANSTIKKMSSIERLIDITQAVQSICKLENIKNSIVPGKYGKVSNKPISLGSLNEKECGFVKNIINNYLTKNGIPENFLSKVEKLLPAEIKEDVLTQINKCINGINTSGDIEFLEARILELTEGFPLIPYVDIVNAKSHNLTISSEGQKVLEFYEKNPEYKVPGAYLLEVAGCDGDIEDISVLKQLVFTDYGIADLIRSLNERILPAELKHVLDQTITYCDTMNK